MKIKRLLSIVLPCVLIAVSFLSCEEEGTIGSSLSKSEVTIIVDSSFKATGKTVEVKSINSKSMTQLIGRLSVPEYGNLTCSFVSQFMPAISLDIPDSITVDLVDSMKLCLSFNNGNLTGDSLAPQQLKVYRLNKQLPSDITNTFDPTGYYDISGLIGTKSYTGSALGMNDTLLNKNETRSIYIELSQETAINIFNEYRNNPETFQWHSNFVNYFPGIFVEQSFGRGCVINITSTDVRIYYHTVQKTNTTDDDGKVVTTDKIIKDSTTVFTVSPEILSSINIKYNISESLKNKVSEGEFIITSPAGYNVEVYFPTQEILDKFITSDYNLAVINNLTFTIPVNEVSNDYGITPPPYLLMVKTSEIDNFFASSLIPDNKTSFYASYDSEKKQYDFTSMREYIVELRKNGGITDEKDCTFTLIPVEIEMETSGYDNSTMVVSLCTPYISRPSMCSLDMENAKIKFTYSKQSIR